ncbi:HvfA family oxazolone/thioamide-modified RiPP metallophore [Pseudomonas sp. GT1P32]
MFKLSTSSLTLGLIIAGGLALSNVASASESEAFSMKQLAHGYSQAHADTDTAEKPAEGKCGEGKCGAGE